MGDQQLVSAKPSIFTWRLYVLLFILLLVIAWVLGIPRWFQTTPPRYNGKVTLTEVTSPDLNGNNGVIGYPQSKEFKNTTISASIPNSSLSSELKNKSELQHPYNTYEDKLGNVYIAVNVQQYYEFTGEICKIYKVEGNSLLLVQHLPDELWCNGPPNDTLFTDYKGNWLVQGMTNGGDTADVYKIEGTTALYVPEFQPMQVLHFFYNTEDGGILYASERTNGHRYYKVTFTP